MYSPAHDNAGLSTVLPMSSHFDQNYPKREASEPYPSPHFDLDNRSTPKRRRIAAQGVRPLGACTRCKRLKVIFIQDEFEDSY